MIPFPNFQVRPLFPHIWQSLVSLNSDYKFMRQSMEAERFVGDIAEPCYCTPESVQT